ncbi:MAG: bifunctional nuclease family protein [Anaerolineaceae bacterium]|nr:bifunctional nuclease family protein [Anaerolineaceae bacterium]
MAELIEVKVDSLRVSLTNQQRIIVLKQVKSDRYLPIWIGPYESEAITIALQEIEVSRPQTHDLVKNVIKSLDGKIISVIIKSLRDDIFYGALVIEKDGKTLEIDSRPSDAIAVAVRAHVPIMVAKKVMDEASVTPEAVTPEDELSENENELESNKLPNGKDRLSIFKEYLDTKSDQESGKDDKSDKDKPKK